MPEPDDHARSGGDRGGFDPAAFDGQMASLDPAMTIVTAVAGDQRAGCLVGFHSQCSIDPRRYSVWLSKANHTTRTAVHGRHLAVHFLRAEDLHLAELFGEATGDEVDKFSLCDWQPGPGGVPLLTGCPERLVVERVALLEESSDHVCLVTRPIESHATGSPFAPLRLSQVAGLSPGHDPDERTAPRNTRAGG